MLLTIDAGNTNSVFAVFDNDKLLVKWRIAADNKRTMDEYASILSRLFTISALDFSNIKDVIICSVVPQNLFSLKSFSKHYFNCNALVIGENGFRPDMIVDIDTPGEVGADRLVNAFAAYKKQPKAWIIVDFGTATTFDVINKNGHYIGGVIAPGINLSVEILHKAAAKLPEIAIAKPKQALGKSTISAMQSGIYFGYLGLVDGIIENLKQELKEDMDVMATGGLASLFFEASKHIQHLEEDLTIIGLKDIYTHSKWK